MAKGERFIIDSIQVSFELNVINIPQASRAIRFEKSHLMERFILIIHAQNGHGDGCLKIRIEEHRSLIA